MTRMISHPKYNWKNLVFKPVLQDNKMQQELNECLDTPWKKSRVWRPYTYTPLRDVRCVMMYDFPYEDVTDGLAYSSQPGHLGNVATRSLLTQWRKYLKKRTVPHFSLSSWAKRSGILLPFYRWTNDNTRVYERIAYRTLATLRDNHEQMVYVLASPMARELAPLIDNPNHLVLTELTDVFRQINDYYRDNPIDFRIY